MEHHTHTAVLPKVSDLFTGAFKSAHASLGMVWNLIARFAILPGVIVWAVTSVIGIIFAALHASPVVLGIVSGVLTVAGMIVRFYYQLQLTRSVMSSNLVNPAEDAPATARGAMGYSKASLGKMFVLSVVILLLVYGFSILLFVPGIIVSLMVMFATASFVIEDTGSIRAALARSRAITDGHKWGLLGRMLLLILALGIVVGIVALLAFKVSLVLLVLMIPVIVYVPGFLYSFIGMQYKALATARPAAKKEFKKWVLIVMPLLGILAFAGIAISMVGKMMTMGRTMGMPADPAAIEQMMNDPEFQKMDPESQKMILDMMKNGTAAMTAEPTDPAVDTEVAN